MRHRDGPTVEVEQRIVGDPAAIWALVTDIGLPVRFSAELQAVEWVSDVAEVAVGSRFRGRNRNEHLGEWETECEIVEVEPNRRWVWEVHGPHGGVGATWGFEVDPGREAVTVRQWARIGPGASGMTIAIESMPDKEGRIISHRLEQLRANMSANLEGLRRIVEHGAA